MNDTNFPSNLASLDELFADYGYFHPDQAPDGYLPLGGLPGSVELKASKFLFVKPHEPIRDAVARCCTCGTIGGFRAVRSAYHMRDGLLPVTAYDFARIASFLIALVPYAEHERFAGEPKCTVSKP